MISRYLNEWNVRKSFAAVFFAVFLAAGIYAVLWEPEQQPRGSLVMGSETAPVTVVEMADFT